MRQQSNHAAAAQMIRAELKKNGIKASVRSESYSMGSSVRVKLLQDVGPAARKEIEEFAGQFQYGHFDGMQDLYEYSNKRSDLPQVKFVFIDIEYSDEIKQAARDYIANISGIEAHERDHYEYMALRGSWGDFWSARKPRVRLPAAAPVAAPVVESNPVLRIGAELAAFVDPSGALRKAGLVTLLGQKVPS
jgi:hypothetical protein